MPATCFGKALRADVGTLHHDAGLTQWRKWNGAKLSGVWSADGLVAEELYDHTGGFPADSPGCFDYDQVNLCNVTAHQATKAALVKQLEAHYAVDHSGADAVE